MRPPLSPPNEVERLAALHRLGVLDTQPEERFDRICRLVKTHFEVPIVLISLVDSERQWFKSRQGIEMSELPRFVSFCGHAILGEKIFVVEDAVANSDFFDNPLVTDEPNIRFYAGAPLHSPDQECIGTLCIIDKHQRSLSTKESASLRDFADLVENELALAYIRVVEGEAGGTDYNGQIEALNRSQMIIEFNLDGSIIRANANYLRAFGYSEPDLKGKHHSIFVNEDFKASVEYREFWAGLRAGKFQSGEFARVGKDGREVWIEASYNPIIGLDGKPIKVMKFATDVTDKVRIRSTLKDTETRLRAILDNVADGIITIDNRGTINSINLAAVKLFGYTPEEVVGQNVKMLMPEPNRSRHDDYLSRYQTTGDTKSIGVGRNLEGITKSGQTFSIELTVTEVAIRGDRLFVCVIKDISERMAAETNVRGLTIRLGLAIDSAKLGTWDWEIEKNVLIWDDRMFSLYGVFRDTFGGAYDAWLRGVHPEDRGRCDCAIQAALAGEKPYDIDFRVIWPDGTIRWIQAHGKVLRNDFGQPIRMVGINYDITQRIQSAEETKLARQAAEAANRAKSDFLANMSHEIRTPMNAIIGMTHLSQRTDPTPKQKNYLTKIDSAAQSLLGIINDILDFSKIEAGKLELERIPFSLDEVLTNLADIVGHKAEQKGIEIVYSVARSVPRFLVGDPLRLGQILINLVGNAIKFTDRGEIIVTVVEMDGGCLQFSVRDSGIGMSPDQVGNLFKSFNQADTSVTRKYGGTGLGLAISKQLCELMGGTICVESEPGKGSTFHFSACFGVASQGPVLTARARLDDLLKRRILIVDDSENARDVLAAMLGANGLAAEAVQSGEAALTTLAQASEAGTPFDLVLMDWRMPGIDGIEASRRIKANTTLARTPSVLMVSAFGREEMITAESGATFDGFLIKPVNESHLIDTIARMFGGEAAAPVTEDQHSSDKATAAELTGRRVLLVEDHEINRELAVELLGDLGIAVTVAVTGQEGVERVMAEPFDMVLMDIQMPVMDGLTATRLIRADARFRALPIIAMTAHAMSGDREKSLDAGMNDHITKPINPTTLTETLIRWMPPRRVECAKTPAPESTSQPPAPSQATVLPDQLPPFDLQPALARANGKPKLLRKMLVGFAAK